MKFTFVISREEQEDKVFSLGQRGMSIVIAVGVCLGTLFAVGGYNLYHAYLEQQELKEYRAQYGEYTEKLQKLIEDNDKMQRDLAQVAILEKQVREFLEKDKQKVAREAIDKKSQELDKQGVGGDNNATKMQILEVQNQLTVKRIVYKRENLNNMLVQLSGMGHYVSSSGYCWPLKGGEISSCFGVRSDPFGSYSADFHPGIDIAVSYGTPIHAAASGTVVAADWNGGYGNYARISHGGGTETAYGHMSTVVVNNGQKVERGEVIGYVGSSGASTGPHLHFEVLQDGIQIDPLGFAQPN